jgi:sterol desaturase/sphingolipid hydroxylase (fatty acid hydroxylase superfamily)
MDFLAFQFDKLQQAGAALLAPGSIFSLPQVAVAIVIAVAYLAYGRFRRCGAIQPAAVLRAVLRRRIIFNRSTGADLFYYLVNTFAVAGLIGWALISSVTVSDVVVGVLRASFGPTTPSTAPEWALRAGMTLAAFLGYELAYYIDHYLKHKIPFLWEFHKVHHTAEVLTPLTVFRVHPIDTLIFIDVVALVTGLFQGMFSYAAGTSISIYAIDQANVITVAFLFLLAPLQHSQFWIPFTGLTGRILLSPAHHQIHHSCDAAHYDRNLGSCLAIFDWMFGTLGVPPKKPLRLKFGVAEPGQDPHSISNLLIDPVVKGIAALGVAARPDAESAGGLSPVPVTAIARHDLPPVPHAGE